MPTLKLPTPDGVALAHSQQLTSYILNKIQRQGPLCFADYMQACLYAPGLGYYSAGAQKFGEAGDFVTAPELSPLFARCLANQCEEVLTTLSQPVILEFGAGSGALAIELLKTLQLKDCLPDRYLILEVSAELRDRQKQAIQQAIPDLVSRVQWLERLPETPVSGVIIANEVLDAMPVHRFLMRQNTLQEYYVNDQDGQFVWKLGEASEAVVKMVEHLGVAFPDHYTSEINLYLPGWIKSVAESLQQGVCLLIDYGFPRREFYHPQRNQGTLMCHYRHHSHDDPFFYPGLQDITAHVDFTAVVEAAVDHGFELEGFTNQAAFLMSCGLTDWLQQAEDDQQAFNWNQQVKRLTLPSEMGELFKVMALSKNWDSELVGFSMLDQSDRL